MNLAPEEAVILQVPREAQKGWLENPEEACAYFKLFVSSFSVFFDGTKSWGKTDVGESANDNDDS